MQRIPNPVYLFQGIVLRRGAKGTGMKSIELALSMCDIVDIYGFTVDPGYTEWLVQKISHKFVCCAFKPKTFAMIQDTVLLNTKERAQSTSRKSLLPASGMPWCK